MNKPSVRELYDLTFDDLTTDERKPSGWEEGTMLDMETGEFYDMYSPRIVAGKLWRHDHNLIHIH